MQSEIEFLKRQFDEIAELVKEESITHRPMVAGRLF